MATTEQMQTEEDSGSSGTKQAAPPTQDANKQAAEEQQETTMEAEAEPKGETPPTLPLRDNEEKIDMDPGSGSDNGSDSQDSDMSQEDGAHGGLYSIEYLSEVAEKNTNIPEDQKDLIARERARKDLEKIAADATLTRGERRPA